uniref:Uncharacterized protein n=1 Tax=Podarcis muralis TaxID=64176 RepID=A0A670JEU0_PODMU
ILYFSVYKTHPIIRDSNLRNPQHSLSVYKTTHSYSHTFKVKNPLVLYTEKYGDWDPLQRKVAAWRAPLWPASHALPPGRPVSSPASRSISYLCAPSVLSAHRSCFGDYCNLKRVIYLGTVVSWFSNTLEPKCCKTGSVLVCEHFLEAEHALI